MFRPGSPPTNAPVINEELLTNVAQSFKNAKRYGYNDLIGTCIVYFTTSNKSALSLTVSYKQADRQPRNWHMWEMWESISIY